MKKWHFTMTTDGDLPWSFMLIQWEWKKQPRGGGPCACWEASR
jgi:hypothetical protein